MKLSSLNCIARYCIEFSSLILLLIVLVLMHGMGDATFAKQVKLGSVNEKELNFNNVEEETFERPDSTHFSDDILRFSPDSLDFGKSEIGKPIIETVEIHNIHDEKSIQMISVTGTSPFYCSFVEKKILAPRSNTTITVAFLARQEGLVNNTLLVHSNVGLSRLKLFGYGEPSPFRLRPLVGGRVSLNSTFSSVIYLYNPFPTSIQLTEVYSSGANLQLELLNQEIKEDGSADRSVGYWNIPPYEYRPVMKTNFAGRIVSNHTSFIRIHLNSSEQTQLVLPVEIEVCSEPGLYATNNVLDFGPVIAQHLNDLQKPLVNIEVFSTDPASITVVDVYFEAGIPSHALKIQFKGPVIVPPNPSKPVVLGWLQFDPENRNINCTGRCTGKVIIKAQESHVAPLELEYVMLVVEGQLWLPKKDRTIMNDPFAAAKHNTTKSPLNIVNGFDFPIVVNKVAFLSVSPLSLQADSNSSLPVNVVLQPGDSHFFGSIVLEYDSKSVHCRQGTVVLMAKTNLTDIPLPVDFHVNCLRVFVPGSMEPLRDAWDMGTMSSSAAMSTHFFLLNQRTKPVELSAGSSVDNITVEYCGSVDADLMSPSRLTNKLDQVLARLTDKPSKPDIDSAPLDSPFVHRIPAGHFGVFKVRVQQSVVGDKLSRLDFQTTSGQLSIPLKLSVNDGKIFASKVVLMKTFPGRVVSSPILIQSYNTVPVRVKRISLETNDKRFKVEVPPGYIIQPGENTEVKVTFDPSAICPPLVCYASLDIEKEVGHFWLLGHGVYSDTAYIDKELYKLVRNQWMTHSELDIAPTASFRFHTDESGSFQAQVQAQLHWPRLSNKFALKFPSLRVGRKSVKDIVIENPADKPILVQAVHIAHYPNADILLQMMQSIVFHKQWASSDMDALGKTILDFNNLAAFDFASSSAQGLKSSETNRVHEWLGVKPSQDSFTMLLAPGSRQRLGVVFRPLVERNFTSLLILRNNLTVIEVVVLRGEGGSGVLKIDQGNSHRSSADSTGLVASEHDSATDDSLQSVSKIFFEFPESTLNRLCPIGGEPPSRQDDNLNDSLAGVAEGSPIGMNRFVIHQRLRATNVGKMRLRIRHFFIDSSPCEGYGFLVKNCDAVQLQPNQSFDLELFYSPDFTQTTVKHNLFVLLDDEFTKWQRFELIVNIPAQYLSSCLAALPRPAWEAYVGRCLFIITVSLIFLTVFVAYTDATRIVAGPESSLTHGLSKADNGSKASNKDKNVAKIIDPVETDTAVVNGGLANNAKSQTNRLKQRKNAKTTATTNLQLNTKTLRSTNSIHKTPKSEQEEALCYEEAKPRLNHQNSSSSETDSFGSLSNSEASSSNRQSTESLCDISSSSRKNSVDEQTSNCGDKATGKEKTHQENGKKKRAKADWKKSETTKQQRPTESSLKSLVFPPIEEFQTMAKTRSSAQGGNKTKTEERKKKAEVKAAESAKTRKADKTKHLADVVKKNAFDQSAFNMDKILNDIWKQPSDLSSDIIPFPDITPRPVESRPFSKPWMMGDWSNDCAQTPTPSIFDQQSQQARPDPAQRGYLGLRFNSRDKACQEAFASRNEHTFGRGENFFHQGAQSCALPPADPRFSFHTGPSSVWHSSNPAPSPARLPNSSLPFSPVIAPPKSTSPSSTVQQIEQQDNFFQRRSLQPDPTLFDSTGLDFPIVNRREPLFLDNPRPFSRVAPPPGFGNLAPIEPSLELPWIEPVSTKSTLGQEFCSDSIWNCFEPKHDGWPSRNANGDPNWPVRSNDFSRHSDHWLPTNQKESSSDDWFASGSDSMQSQREHTLDSLNRRFPPTSPSPSSSSSSNGRNNN